METRIKEYAATWKGGKRDNKNSLSLIRYADDFVVIHEDINVIKTCQGIIEKWLSYIGLELSQEKTKEHYYKLTDIIDNHKAASQHILIANLAPIIKGKCNYCELTFKSGDKIERDHIVPRQAGGNKLKDNLQLLHKHCHDVKTKTDLETIRRYKYRKVWNRHYQQIQGQFEKLKWIWDNDLPTLV